MCFLPWLMKYRMPSTENGYFCFTSAIPTTSNYAFCVSPWYEAPQCSLFLAANHGIILFSPPGFSDSDVRRLSCLHRLTASCHSVTCRVGSRTWYCLTDQATVSVHYWCCCSSRHNNKVLTEYIYYLFLKWNEVASFDATGHHWNPRLIPCMWLYSCLFKMEGSGAALSQQC